MSSRGAIITVLRWFNRFIVRTSKVDSRRLPRGCVCAITLAVWGGNTTALGSPITITRRPLSILTSATSLPETTDKPAGWPRQMSGCRRHGRCSRNGCSTRSFSLQVRSFASLLSLRDPDNLSGPPSRRRRIAIHRVVGRRRGPITPATRRLWSPIAAREPTVPANLRLRSRRAGCRFAG